MKQTLKATAAILGIIAVGILTAKLLFALLWACYYAGFYM